MAELSPTSVTVEANDIGPPSELVGSDPWGDETDDTYTTTWLSRRSSATRIPEARGTFDAYDAAAVTLHIRASTENAGAAAGRLGAIVLRTAGDAYVGQWSNEASPVNPFDRRVEFPADAAIHDLTLTTLYNGDAEVPLSTVLATLAGGCIITARRQTGGATSDPVPGDYRLTVHELWLEVTPVGPQPEPVFFQSGWVYYDRYDLDQNTYMEDIHVKVMRYLDTLIGSGHNGEVLCIGDYDLRGKPFGAGYYLSDYLGWTLRVIPSPSDFTLPQSEITPVFDEMQAGTYIPRIVYVETGSSGPHLTTDQYLFLRDLMDAGQTALFLQSEKSGGTGSHSWVESFTGGTMRFNWTTDSIVRAAGGYSETVRQRVMLRAALATGKAYLQDMHDQYGLNGWGWYEPVGIEYPDFRARYAVLESNEVYTGLTGVPASSPVVTGVLGIPGLQLLLLGNPPEQIYPRSDGLGIGSADQVYPIPNTYQASPDQWGGYW